MLTERQFKILFGSMLVIVVLWVVLGPLYFFYLRFDGKRMYERVKDHKQIYVHETYSGAINPVMYVTRDSDTSALIKFYSIEELGAGGGIINFPIRMLPYNAVCYLINDTALNNGSKVVEVVRFNTASKTRDYTRGLVYKGTVHLKPPSDSLLKKDSLIKAQHPNIW
ncbi:hypothetical protein CLV51_1042 [Chitinophaga niastensis]|uniref:Uncharacterized protein n=1 Tax=Chitinophaga niastensis TaxID=536980 RepID=A0A2P8HGH3_CHINA|nr:hypothetical protein [Chitinophaga niastensis]PSL45300.1 hypothetical protein CLV51_1042 [Chitinophaga niastensis]